MPLSRAPLQAALGAANVRAFLAVIRAGEGTADGDGYRRCFGGSLFDSFGDHPRRLVTASGYTSTAAGAYQFLSRTWDALVRQYGFPDFSPDTQDEAAVALVIGRKALDDVRAGRIVEAIAKCNREWASLPGSPYGQPTRTMAQALATYAQARGEAAPLAPRTEVDAAQSIPSPAQDEPPAPQPRKGFTMPPFLLAALPALIDAIPQLAKLFGSGSEAAERNVAAVQTVAQIVQDATGAKNIQEAVEAIQGDPAMRQSATAAIESNWFALVEAGGGGIAGAREQDIRVVEKLGGFWRSPSFAAMAVLAPLVYMVVGSIAGLWGYSAWSDDVRAAIATAVVSLVVGGAAGFYWGSTTRQGAQPAKDGAR